MICTTHLQHFQRNYFQTKKLYERKQKSQASPTKKDSTRSTCMAGHHHRNMWKYGDFVIWVKQPFDSTRDQWLVTLPFPLLTSGLSPIFSSKVIVGGKTTQASIAGSSLDIKQAQYTVTSMHVQDQYPAGKWILFHTYYWARRDRMPLQSTVVFLPGRCVAESHETAPQLNNSTIQFDWSFFHRCRIYIITDRGLEYASSSQPSS